MAAKKSNSSQKKSNFNSESTCKHLMSYSIANIKKYASFRINNRRSPSIIFRNPLKLSLKKTSTQLSSDSYIRQ